MTRQKLSIFDSPKADDYKKTEAYLQKTYGHDNLERVYNPGIVSTPHYSWVIGVATKSGVKQYKIYAGPFDCIPGTKNSTTNAYDKLEELGDVGFIHISKNNEKKKVLEELREILPTAEKPEKKGLLNKIFGRKK